MCRSQDFAIYPKAGSSSSLCISKVSSRPRQKAFFFFFSFFLLTTVDGFAFQKKMGPDFASFLVQVLRERLLLRRA